MFRQNSEVLGAQLRHASVSWAKVFFDQSTSNVDFFTYSLHVKSKHNPQQSAFPHNSQYSCIVWERTLP